MNKKLMLVMAMVLGLARPAFASEGEFYGGPIGGTDIRSAYLPPPGLYAFGYGLPGFAGAIYGANSAPAQGVNKFWLRFGNIGGGALVVYPWKIAGGTIASSFSQTYIWGGIKINQLKERNAGWADTYVDILSWSKHVGLFGATPPVAPTPTQRHLPYGLTVSLSFSMIFPDGEYHAYKTLTSGHNDYFYIPNGGFSYLTGPGAAPFGGDGVEYTARLFYDHASLNKDTHYRTGDVLDLDFALSERFDRWQAGITGSLASQIQNDNQYGAEVSPKGKHLGLLILGPVVNYQIPGTTMAVKFKYLAPIWQRNFLAGNVFVVSLSGKIL